MKETLFFLIPSIDKNEWQWAGFSDLSGPEQDVGTSKTTPCQQALIV
jgi:hypothetical protein